ncbi:hypothetical protein ACRALDRAFT_1042838 [Sodiomyces alcalophilus JCM 7366]|uniref:uncharacterized protein n=1 Tax=Sodiomyces alcalophilus JCM 7366 TaxID=591952 RepID=UPI0039B5C49F
MGLCNIMRFYTPAVQALILLLLSRWMLPVVGDHNSLPSHTPMPTLTPGPTARVLGTYLHLFRRQDADCPEGTFMCSSSLGDGFKGICCLHGQVCEYDDSGEPACCPSGAVCTGIAPPNPEMPTTAVSFVPNGYFPFPYIATSLDQHQCSSAVSQCSRNHEACLTELHGGDDGFGVTIIVPGGGGTVIDASRPTLGTSASPVCLSLSHEACFGLEPTHCAQPTTVNGLVIKPASSSAGVPAVSLAVLGVGISIAMSVI